MKYLRKYYFWYAINGETLELYMDLTPSSIYSGTKRFWTVGVTTKKRVEIYKWNWLKEFNRQMKKELKNIIIKPKTEGKK